MLKVDRYILTLWIFCAIGLAIFIGHSSGIIIDIGRELYYPEQILKGKVLYKDIFNIYGALSYQINAIFYKLFGAKLAVLYALAAICSISIVSGIYLISNKFFEKYISFSISCFTIAVGIFTTSIFNFHFPYSWAVLYGITSFLYSLYFLIKYEELKSVKYLYISSVLAGISVSSKYDFLLYSLVILFIAVKNRNLRAILSFLAVPFISYGILFLQGLNFEDICNSVQIIGSMASGLTLKYFYQNSGVYFHYKSLPTDLLLFIKFAVPFVGMVFGILNIDNKKLLSTVLLAVSFAAFLILYSGVYELGFLPVLLVCLAIFGIKKFSLKLWILIFSALSVSVKVFWVLLLKSYGNYYVSILIVASLAAIFELVSKDKLKSVKYSVVMVLTALSLLFVYDGIVNEYHSAQHKIVTEKGKIYTIKSQAESTNEFIKYANSLPEGDMVIFPEGLAINFMSGRKSDDYFNSLLPLYVESFGEDRIVGHFRDKSPQYIVLNNYNTKDYGYEYICSDYALNFCEYIKENYHLRTIIEGELRYLIFEKK